MLIVYIFWLAILLLLWKIARQFQKKEIGAHEFLFWVVFWVAVGVGSVFVRRLDVLAQALGVERAIDLGVYIAVAALFWLVYRAYAKIEKIEREITQVVRSQAIRKEEEK